MHTEKYFLVQVYINFSTDNDNLSTVVFAILVNNAVFKVRIKHLNKRPILDKSIHTGWFNKTFTEI